jgi:hypothetical protein
MLYRLAYLTAVFVTIAAGLISRKALPPSFLDPYLGDALYALMIYWGFRFCFTKQPKTVALFGAVVFCWIVEISQLFSPTWLTENRHSTLGALVLGSGFLWSDMLMYVIGAGTGWGLDAAIARIVKNRTDS